jgi:macrolide-specific efflux system membrane fusion protein
MNDSTNSSAGRRRKSPRIRALVAAGVVLVAVGGWYGLQKYRASKAAEGEYIFAAISSGDIEDLVTSTGTLEPRDYVDVGAQVSGQIEKLYVEVGDEVKQGDVLATIDATTAEARVEANRASLRSSQTSLETQKSNLEKAERDYRRQENLIKEDATTQEALANARTTWINAQNQIKQSEAQIEQQIANMRIEEKNLQYTQIKAPISGTVMSIAVKQGQTVNASQNVPNVLRIANLGTMTVRAEVSEADVSKLYTGMPAYFTTLGGGSRRWPGTLKRKEPTPKVQNSVVLYNALFDVANEGNPRPLMPSMTAQVFFVVAEARNVLTVPMAALQQGQQIVRELAAQEQKASAKPVAVAGSAAGVATAAPGATTGQPPAGFAGGARPPGFNGQAPSAEQMEQFRRMRERGGGALGLPGGMPQAGTADAAAGAARGQARSRPGTVMVKKADGTLESRRVVIGVTNRVLGQVLEGLKEGEEVVIGKREEEAAPAAAAPSQNQQNRNNPLGGGMPGGGFPAGGARPF